MGPATIAEILGHPISETRPNPGPTAEFQSLVSEIGLGADWDTWTDKQRQELNERAARLYYDFFMSI